MNVGELFDQAREQLAAVPGEALGELRVPRRVLGISRAASIVRLGSVWHLGVLLLDEHAVYETGEIVRARQQAPRGYTAESQRARSERAAAARRGGFAEGEAVHIGWRMVDLDTVGRGEASGPLAVRDGIPVVRWSAAGAYVPLAGYLSDRIDLLLHPPQGA